MSPNEQFPGPTVETVCLACAKQGMCRQPCEAWLKIFDGEKVEWNEIIEMERETQ